MGNEPTNLAFWQNQAKLYWLQREHLLRILILAIAASIGIAILLLVPDWRAVGVEEVTVRLVFGMGLAVTVPALLALEMFYKGGSAARDIKREGDGRYAEKFDEWSRLAEEFTQYRIAKEEAVKHIERERGITISALQARVADLERQIDSQLAIETIEKQDSDGVEIRLVVHNSSPLPAESVSIAIDSIVVLEGGTGAEKFIDELRELHLLPRNSGDDKASALVSGLGKKEFYFLTVSKKEKGGTAIINERCIVNRRMGLLGESITLPFLLPSGGYRIGLIVHARNRAACQIYCEVSNHGGFSFRAVDAKDNPLALSSATGIGLQVGAAAPPWKFSGKQEEVLDERTQKRNMLKLLHSKVEEAGLLIKQRVDWNSPDEESGFMTAANKWADSVCDILSADCFSGAIAVFHNVSKEQLDDEQVHLRQLNGGDTPVCRMKANIVVHGKNLSHIIKDHYVT